jgi:6,7-dimethyl-8-ribityllumazine synthase
MRIALVVSEYHAFITAGLERGARLAIAEAAGGEAEVVRVAVPGAFELPQAASRVAASGRVDAVVCLGCLIRGETPHFDYIAQAAAHGITRAAQDHALPISFGVLTTNTADEAMARAADGPANKGREAALAALVMARLYRTLASGTP